MSLRHEGVDFERVGSGICRNLVEDGTYKEKENLTEKSRLSTVDNLANAAIQGSFLIPRRTYSGLPTCNPHGAIY